MILNVCFRKTALSALLLTVISSGAYAQNCTVTATGNQIDVASGQVVCVTSNISNANVNIAGGGTLKVADGYTLSVQNFNNFNGTLINNGTLLFGNVNFGTGGQLVNNNTVTFQGSPNTNGAATIVNNEDAVMTFNNGISLHNGSALENAGSVVSLTDVSTNSGTTLTNSGRFEITGGNFNPNGSVTNDGFFKVNNFINLNGGTVYNNCRFVVGNGFNNSATFINDGLVWVTNPTTGKIQNNSNGSWSNTPKGSLRGHDFHNNGTVTGSGNFYFTGDTRQQGSFSGVSSNVEYVISFYDASYNPNTTGSFFDFGMQGVNVVRPTTPFIGDTLSFGEICALQTFDKGTPLPLSLISFEVTAEGNDVILSWTTTEEKEVAGFEVQYSADGKNWLVIGKVAANGYTGRNDYRFTHTNPAATVNFYRLKIMDLDAHFSYSTIKVIDKRLAETGVSIYPNPFGNQLTWTSRNKGAYEICIRDIAGKIVLQATVEAQPQQEQHLNTGALNAGLYFMTVAGQANHQVIWNGKVVKK